MDDVLGQAMIFFNLLLIAFRCGRCRESWRDKESHTMRLVTITVLSIIPIALMVLTATGCFTPRCASPGVGLKPFIW